MHWTAGFRFRFMVSVPGPPPVMSIVSRDCTIRDMTEAAKQESPKLSRIIPLSLGSIILIYFLSMGPAYRCLRKGALEQQFFSSIYAHTYEWTTVGFVLKNFILHTCCHVHHGGHLSP